MYYQLYSKKTRQGAKGLYALLLAGFFFCLIFTGCILGPDKKIVVHDKKTGVDVTISEDQLEITGEIKINDDVTIQVQDEAE